MMEKVGAKHEGFTKRLHYRFMRHPIMTGFFMMFLFAPHMTYNRLFFSVNCVFYILIAVKCFEEPDMLKLFPQ